MQLITGVDQVVGHVHNDFERAARTNACPRDGRDIARIATGDRSPVAQVAIVFAAPAGDPERAFIGAIGIPDIDRKDNYICRFLSSAPIPI